MPEQLSGRVVAVDALADAERDAMFALFSRYYDAIERSRFDADLSKKSAAILLEDRGGRVRGFSTMQDLAVDVDGKTYYGLFSGDTVVARECWGQRVLGRVFLRELFLRKARHPFSPYYWFLISKGYKTYLLMANNFREHYPRHEVPTPDREQAVLDAFATYLFPEAYDAEGGLVRFPRSLGQLKPGVADITPELIDQNQRVAYYAAKNPEWRTGTELACIARMTWSMPLVYSAKAVWKTAFASSRPSRGSITATAR